MIKIEEVQQHGKEQFDAAIAAAGSLQKGVQAIAIAFGDYTRKSFEDGNAFTEKLAGVKSLDKAIEAQTEYAKTAYETFVAESQKIGELYADLARQTYKPFEDFAAKFVPVAR
jgi:phasin family protein